MKYRLDQLLVKKQLATSRSQAANLIQLGQVTVRGSVVKKPGVMVDDAASVHVTATERYVSRAGLKLASVAELLDITFKNKIVLDVGSSTGGFTDYALQHGAHKVYAVDVGTEQLHPSLRGDDRIRLYEKTDIRAVRLEGNASEQEASGVMLEVAPDIIVIDVSFISLRDILPHIASLTAPHTQVVAMLKPQFEAGRHQTNKGIIKNNAVRRQILADFELWVDRYFAVRAKRDSDVAGAKGNVERFYLLTPRT